MVISTPQIAREVKLASAHSSRRSGRFRGVVRRV